MSKVRIKRHRNDDMRDEVYENSISNARWDIVGGGIQLYSKMPVLYGYIPYELAKDLDISISGRHDFGYNDAKICMIPADNLGKGNEEYEPAYCRFIVHADYNSHFPYFDLKRTKTVSECLKNHPLSRKELMNQLEDKGFDAKNIREAINILLKAGYLNIAGSPRGQNSILSLSDDFPY